MEMEILQKDDADILSQILEQRMQEVREGKVKPADQVFRELRERNSKRMAVC